MEFTETFIVSQKNEGRLIFLFFLIFKEVKNNSLLNFNETNETN